MSMELPEHLRTGPMAEAAKRALQDAASMAASSNSIPRVSLRGREFRFIENGEEIVKFRDHIDVIIVGVEPQGSLMIKTWYEKGYQPGSKEPPTCASEDGVAPAQWVQNRQSQSCRTCPKNVFGSATSPNGKATKACRDSKRIWIKLAKGNTVNGKPYEVGPFEDRTLYGMGVTVASLKAFSEHGRSLAALGQGPQVCVTRITMMDTEFPQVEFKVQDWLNAEDAPKSIAMATERPWRLLTNAGLALNAPTEESTPLPGGLPGLPAHLQKAAAAEVVDATPAPAGQVKSGKNLDDVVDKF